jgi:uncharacterized membrane protein
MGESENGLTPVVRRNIEALAERRHAAAERRAASARLADRVTRFAGSGRFVVIHLVVYAVWLLVNLPLLSLPRFDPSLVGLATEASVEAIFLSTFVLMTQNRMQAIADERADLDLQVGLLAEHEISRLIALTDSLAARLGVPPARRSEADELARDVAPEQVLDEIRRAGDE